MGLCSSIFNSYVSLPEGMTHRLKHPSWAGKGAPAAPGVFQSHLTHPQRDVLQQWLALSTPKVSIPGNEKLGNHQKNRWSSTVHAKVCDVPLPRFDQGIMFLASITFPRLNHHFYLRICWSGPTKKFRNALPYRFPTLIMFNYYVLYI